MLYQIALKPTWCKDICPVLYCLVIFSFYLQCVHHQCRNYFIVRICACVNEGRYSHSGRYLYAASDEGIVRKYARGTSTGQGLQHVYSGDIIGHSMDVEDCDVSQNDECIRLISFLFLSYLILLLFFVVVDYLFPIMTCIYEQMCVFVICWG